MYRLPEENQQQVQDNTVVSNHVNSDHIPSLRLNKDIFIKKKYVIAAVSIIKGKQSAFMYIFLISDR
jgi:hypothetical protein